jgi:hypothetical protein
MIMVRYGLSMLVIGGDLDLCFFSFLMINLAYKVT